jgi:hypothetical protein
MLAWCIHVSDLHACCSLLNVLQIEQSQNKLISLAAAYAGRV